MRQHLRRIPDHRPDRETKRPNAPAQHRLLIGGARGRHYGMPDATTRRLSSGSSRPPRATVFRQGDDFSTLLMTHPATSLLPPVASPLITSGRASPRAFFHSSALDGFDGRERCVQVVCDGRTDARPVADGGDHAVFDEQACQCFPPASNGLRHRQKIDSRGTGPGVIAARSSGVIAPACAITDGRKSLRARPSPHVRPERGCSKREG